MSAPPRIDTPLGAVTFAVQAGTTSLSAKPDTVDGTLYRWRPRVTDVELKLGPTDSLVPDGYPPVTLWAARWLVTVAVAWSEPTELPATWYAVDLPLS